MKISGSTTIDRTDRPDTLGVRLWIDLGWMSISSGDLAGMGTGLGLGRGPVPEEDRGLLGPTDGGRVKFGGWGCVEGARIGIGVVTNGIGKV